MMKILESQASDQAEKMHLDYMKFGRWGKNGVVTHKTDDNGKLVAVKKSEVPAGKPASAKGATVPASKTVPSGKPIGKPAAQPQQQGLKVGNIQIGPDKKSVMVRGQPIKLSNTEYKLLKMLATQKGQITTRSDLLQKVWDAAPDIITRTVDMYVSRLKRKLASSGANIQSVRGMGYRMHDLPEATDASIDGISQLTPEIQAKLLERAQKNVRWCQKLDGVLSKLPDGDEKKIKVQKIHDVLKIQALLIIKSIRSSVGSQV